MGRGSHGPGGGAGHSHSEEYPDDTWNLYQHIAQADALNAVDNSALSVFRPFARRLETAGSLHSDGDEEMLVKVVFASPCSIRRLMVVGGGNPSHHPRHVRVYVGHEDLDFQSIEDVIPVYETSLPVNQAGEAYVNVHPTGAFTNVTTVSFFFDANHGSVDETIVQYIGMQGDHTHDKRQAVQAKYELLSQGHGQKTHIQMDSTV
ncbi:hypothetical protein CTAYLR_007501 [Chrysophaeum taylorii]|uniref:PITH domain-containing protein n=1 Tax=Chrysophaeum taylorii TaxID=2483200 RepID=A0AAD7UMD2_9STRA|nr:hypothetical protein CTAYLR_007501 [Chrysophaeum taylorii]